MRNSFPLLRKLKYLSARKENVDDSLQIQQSVKNLTNHLPYLKKLYLCDISFEGCSLIFLEFVHYARNLKEIHMHLWYLKLTPKLAFQIVEIVSNTERQCTIKIVH